MKPFLKSYFSIAPIFYNADDGAGIGGANEGAIGEGSTQTKPTGFSGTLVEKKDPVSGQAIKVPVELESYIGHIISSTRNATEGQYKPMLEKLESETVELGEIRGELEKLREANMSAEEKAQANAARKIAEHEAKVKNATQEAQSWKERFQSTTITNDILASFGDVKLCNPEQTAILLRNEGKAEVVEVLGHDGKPTGEFQTRLNINLVNEKTGEIEQVEGTPKELFKRWINEDRNLHHQFNNLTPGANSNGGRKGPKGIDYMSMSAEERLRVAREQ